MQTTTSRSGSASPSHAPRARYRLWRATASLLSLLLLVGTTVVVPSSFPAAAQQGPSLGFAKSAAGQVLAGGSIPYSLTATNPADGDRLYNVSFRDVLPLGVTYDAGSSQPSAAGEPRIITAEVAVDGGTLDQQTLIWDNVSDLPAGGTVEVSFTATPAYEGFGDPPADDGQRVGDTLTNTGQAAASAEPRFIPRTDDGGAFSDDRVGVVISATDDAVTTITALEIAKAEPSPSGRLLRGLADQVTVYTLTVTNSEVAATDDVVVVDRLPAQLEFLGCEALTASEEYNGAGTPSLPALVDCVPSTSVDTIYVDGEIVTEVTWNLGQFAPAEVRTIEYRAAIPLLANALFEAGSEPPTSGLGHGANLDNNTGPSTRELTASSQAVTNEVVATGVYTGPVADGTSPQVTADDDLTRTVADVRIQKSADPTSFVQENPVEYALTIDVSQYIDASGIVVTDVLPDGLCPFVNADDPQAGPVPEGCRDAMNGSAPEGATFGSITAESDGSFTIIFDGIDDIDANGTSTITYTALARPDYDGIDAPTVAGDAFTNTADLQATTTPIGAPDDFPTGESGDESLTDTASATVTTTAEGLFKRVLPRPADSDGLCPGEGYVDQYPFDADGFQEGDRVCFEVEARFSDGVDTRNAVLTDFLPPQVAYESSTVITDPCGDDCVVVDATGTGGAGEDVVTYTLGALDDADDRFVPPGGVFVVHIAGTVRDVPIGTEFDLTGNLVKLNSENTAGEVRPQRAEVEIPISPVPNVGIVKGVANVERAGTDLIAGGLPNPATAPPADIDGVEVRQGDVVTYRIDVDNDADDASVNVAPVNAIQVWDVLPDGITCSDVADTSISDGGICLDSGATTPDYPTLWNGDGRSVIIWDLDAASVQLPIDPGASLTLTYNVTLPSGVAIEDFFPPAASSTLPNDAYVRSFTSPNNLGAQEEFLPQDNIDGTVNEDSWNAQPLADPSEVLLPDAQLDKQVVATSQQGDANNDLTNAVNGEVVTYEVELRLPARTTVYDATLSDVLPTGLTAVPDPDVPYEVVYFPDADATGPGDVAALPTDVALADGVLSWPAQYDVGATDELYVLTIRASVDPAASIGNRTNTASFSFFDASDGVAGRTERTESATADIEVVSPQPSLTKSNDATGAVVGDDTILFTLDVSTGSADPPLHDAVVVDCLPAGLAFTGFVGPVDGSAALLYSPVSAEPGSCDAGETELTWVLGTVEPDGPAIVLTYDATVRDDAVGGDIETNTARLTGSSLDDVGNDAAVELVLTRDDDSSVTIAGASVVKSVAPESATIGEEVTFTVVTTLPANVGFFDLVLLDLLPAGLDPAVTLDSIDCAPAGDDCDAIQTDPAQLTRLTDATAGDDTAIGWLLGDVTASAQERTLTLTYRTTVQDLTAPVAPVRGDDLVNTARVAWNLTGDGGAPTSASDTFDVEPAGDDATVRVLEPEVGIAKSVDVGPDRADGRPEPGDTFTYTVTVTNRDLADVSDAFDLVISDEVPVGVVIDEGTIFGGGVYDAGNRTITWAFDADGAPAGLTRLAPGASVALTYDATLVPSSQLTAATLTNTASVDAYASLPTGGRDYVGPNDTAEVTPAFPELAIAKTLPDGELTYLGEPLLWQLVISSIGDGRAFALEVVDELPRNWAYVAGSAVVGGVTGATADPELTGGLSNPTLTWSAAQLASLGLAELAPGDDLTISFRAATNGSGVILDPGVGSNIAQTNTATVTGDDRSGADGNADGPYTATDDASARIDASDLVIEKTTTDDAVAVAGDDLTWTVAVSNLGPDTAVGPFTVTDTLPDGVDFDSATGTGWVCGMPDADRELTCTRTNQQDTLANGASFPAIEVTVAIPANTAADTPFTNEASVIGRTYDPDSSNNTDDDMVTVATLADLRIVKTLSGDLVAGLDATYTLVVDNLGPSVSLGPITVTDAVPDGTSFVSAAGDGWDCTEAAGTVTCVRAADLAVGEVAPQIVLVVAVDSARTGDVVNTATVTGTTDDPSPANDTSTVTTTPTLRADLGIEKALQGEFVAGQPATYRLTVTNFGPSDAAGVTVTDDVPVGMSFDPAVGAAGDGWTCGLDDGTITCALAGTLAATEPDDVRVLELTFATSSDPGALGDPVTNTAVVFSDIDDPNPSNDEDTDDNTVTGEADLSVVKSHEGPVLAGEQFTVNLVVENDGPSDAAAPITLTDVLPDGMTFVEASGSEWVCSEDDGTVVCTLVDDGWQQVALPAGATAPLLAITVLVDASVGPTTLRNIASVDSPTSDPVPGNNTDTDDVVIGTQADLSIVKTTVGDNPVLAGERTRFEIQVTNAGPSTATSVSVVDELPSGVSLVQVSGDGWDCDATTALTLRCDRPELEPGDAPVITVVVDVLAGVPSGTVLTNVARVSSATPDPTPEDNEDDSTVTVDAEADLILTKTGPGSAPTGGQAVFSFSLTNDGPSDAIAPIRIVDQLPAGLTFVSASGPWDCEAEGVTADGQQVTCVLDGGGTSLAGGATAPTLQIRTRVSGMVGGTLTNVATADSPTVDPDPERATDDAVTTVTALANLNITKSHEGPVRIGDAFTFTIEVRNAGPSPARGVRVVDVLPAGLTPVAADGDGWTCTLDGQEVTCDLAGSLGAGAVADPISIEVAVSAAAYPTAVNTAVVTSSTPESDPGDNTTTDTVTVPPLVDLGIDKSHSGDFVVGQQGTFTLTITNLGPIEDPGPITVVDELPDGLEPVAASGDGWTCDLDGGVMTCVHAAGLAVDASTTIVLEVRVLPDAAPGVVNEATVSSDAEDTDPSNDRDDDQVPVAPVSLLTASKVAVAETDGTLTWDITIGNDGPNATSEPIVVVDDLVDELTFSSASGEGWMCEAVAQVVTCVYVGSLPVGAETVVTLITDVDAAPGTRLTNSVRVSGGGGEADGIGVVGSVITAETEVTVGEIARTGADVLALLAAGLGLLGIGAVLLRRRRGTPAVT